MSEIIDQETEIDITNACRLCLVCEEGAEMINMDQLVLQSCGIELDASSPNLPHQICGNCNAVLLFIQKFRKMCENSDIYLREYCSKHENNLKIEVIHTQNPEESTTEIVLPHEYDAIESFQVQDEYQDVQAEVVAKEETLVGDEESGEYLFEIESNVNDEGHQNVKVDVDVVKSDMENDSPDEMWIEESCQLDEQSNGTIFIVDDSNSVDVGTVRTMNMERVKKGKSKDRKAVIGRKTKRANVESHVCEICGNSYKRLGALETHRRRHLNHRPFECEICGETFSFNFMLERHMRKHTGDRPFSCEYCNRKFVDRSTMSRHQKIHRNERAYKCDTCGKSFTYYSVLKTHIMSHTGEKPYSCGICEKGFHRASDLKNHLETLQHRKDPRAAMLLMAIKRKN